MRRLLLAALTALAAAIPAPAHAAAPARPPVVMVVLDEFPLADIQRADGRIDRERFPGFAALAGGSTWFPNANAVHDSTHFAVPAMLTGLAPRPGRDSPTYLNHPRSLFTYLDGLGYRVHSREEATTVCPPRLCPRADRYGNPHYNILHRRRERLDHTIASLRPTKRPTLTFHHSVLPHVPWAYLPSGQARTGYREGVLPDFASPAGFGDEFLTEFNEQRHLLQAGFADAEVGRLVARLKKTRQWKDALVVVTADQAISFQVGTGDRRQVTESNIHEVAPVPLFVKRPGQTRGATSRSYVNGLDVLPTIAGLLRRPLGRRADGASVFGRAAQARRQVRMQRRDLSGDIVVPAAQMELRRALDRLRRRDVFGNGRWSRVYRIGPHRSLLGRRVGHTPSPAPGAPRARFAVPGDLRRVDPEAAEVPTLAAGWLEPGSLAGGRDIALAVNGRVAAVGRSFHLAGRNAEWFALNLPPSALRRGRNAMALYAVEPDLRLTPLGASR